MAFTAVDTLTPAECASIRNCAILTGSADGEVFHAEPRETPLSRLLKPSVITQAVKTVMSAANEELATATPDNFEERTENGVAQEFQNVLQTIATHLQ
jgi:hypothetical protein